LKLNNDLSRRWEDHLGPQAGMTTRGSHTLGLSLGGLRGSNINLNNLSLLGRNVFIVEGHLKSACPQLVGRRTCHRCGQEGYFIKDCPAGRSTVLRPLAQPQPHQTRRGARPQAVGRLYAMNSAEVARSGNLIIESCVIAGKSLHVLYDSGARHSFVRNLKW